MQSKQLCVFVKVCESFWLSQSPNYMQPSLIRMFLALAKALIPFVVHGCYCTMAVCPRARPTGCPPVADREIFKGQCSGMILDLLHHIKYSRNTVHYFGLRLPYWKNSFFIKAINFAKVLREKSQLWSVKFVFAQKLEWTIIYLSSYFHLSWGQDFLNLTFCLHSPVNFIMP